MLLSANTGYKSYQARLQYPWQVQDLGLGGWPGKRMLGSPLLAAARVVSMKAAQGSSTCCHACGVSLGTGWTEAAAQASIPKNWSWQQARLVLLGVSLTRLWHLLLCVETAPVAG